MRAIFSEIITQIMFEVITQKIFEIFFGLFSVNRFSHRFCNELSAHPLTPSQVLTGNCGNVRVCTFQCTAKVCTSYSQ